MIFFQDKILLFSLVIIKGNMLTSEEINAMLAETIISGLLTKRELQEIIRSLGIKVTGVVGPYVLRYKDEKLIISHRPVHFQMSNSQKAKSARRLHQQGKFEFALTADYSEAEKSGYGQLLSDFLYSNELKLHSHLIYDFKPK